MRSFLLLIVLTIPALRVVADPAFDPAPWLADFAQLRDELASHYSTFQGQVATRRMDLAALVASTDEALRKAKDATQARAALRRFLNAFGDAHLSISWPAPPSTTSPSEPPSLCRRLGYGDDVAAPGIAFDRLASYRPLHDADERYFPGGVLTVAGRRVGILRIALFSETLYPELCDAATQALHVAADASCDLDCEERISTRAGDALTEVLMRRLRALEKEGIDLLAVDITGNGGGTDWGEPAARVLTARPIRGAGYGFIRHPHWVTALRKALATVQSDLSGAAAADRPRLDAAAVALTGAIAAASKPCDLAPLWRNATVDCNAVVDRPLFVTGLLRYAAPGSLPDLPSRAVLFSPSRYRYEEGVYRGPLAILVDEDTGSSAERFTAMLRDNDAATVVGVPTGGAGCGYTDGGIPTLLPRTGARVRMPDCVQFRFDGTNAVGGITPDLLVPWRSYDAPFQRASRAAEALATLAKTVKGKQ